MAQKVMQKVNRRDMLLDDEQELLAEKDAEGWKLVKVANTNFKFEKCEPGEYHTFFYYEPNPSTRDQTMIRARKEGAEILNMTGNNNYKYFVRKASMGEFELERDLDLKMRAYKSQRFIQTFNAFVALVSLIAIIRFGLKYALNASSSTNTILTLVLFGIFAVAVLLIMIKAYRYRIYYQKKIKQVLDDSIKEIEPDEEETAEENSEE